MKQREEEARMVDHGHSSREERMDCGARRLFRRLFAISWPEMVFRDDEIVLSVPIMYA